jgi:prepilin-type N-terminal cleavage/methylation domain-containing protein
MARNRNLTRRQDGFTLIEIIAVLVILGVLAIVAVPKYFSLQDNARQQAAAGLVSSAQSQLSMQYANNKLNSNAAFANAQTVCDMVSLGNITTETPSINCTGNVTDTVTITGTVGNQTATATWINPEYNSSAS